MTDYRHKVTPHIKAGLYRDAAGRGVRMAKYRKRMQLCTAGHWILAGEWCYEFFHVCPASVRDAQQAADVVRYCQLHFHVDQRLTDWRGAVRMPSTSGTLPPTRGKRNDPQVYSVYAAERAVDWGRDDKLDGAADVEEYAEWCWRQSERSYSDRPRVVYHDDRRYKTARAYVGRNLIIIPATSALKHVVRHELAHKLDEYGNDNTSTANAHGPEFVRELVYLTHECEPGYIARRLEDELAERFVEW